MTRRGHFSATESEDKGSEHWDHTQGVPAQACVSPQEPKPAWPRTFLVHHGRITLTWTGPRESAAGPFGRMAKIRRRARSEEGIKSGGEK